MDRKLLVILAVGTFVMASTAFWLYPGRPKSVEPLHRNYMHCWNCSREFPYNQERFQNPCPMCSSENSMIATKEPLAKTESGPNPSVGMFVVLLVEINVFLVTLVGYFVFARRKQADEEFLYTECTHCPQKLRYRATRVGAVGQCPRCKNVIVFPDLEVDEDDLPWWKPARWRRAFSNLTKKITIRKKATQEVSTEENEP